MPSHPATQATKDLDKPKGYGHRIGVFDSGLGGLSVLRALQKQLPCAEMLYVADSRNAPYGEKDQTFILQRSEIIADFLLHQGAQVIVIACNTATAAAVQHLRSRWPDVAIVGVEPGVKPAVSATENGNVGVMATPGTLASPKFRTLIERHKNHANITVQPCPGLAAEIEGGDLDTPRLRELVARFSKPLSDAHVDTVVLGCTHYPFVRPLLEQTLGSKIRLIDTSDAIAKHVQSVVDKLPASHTRHTPAADKHEHIASTQAKFWTSGDPAHLNKTVKNWLQLDIKAERFPS